MSTADDKIADRHQGQALGKQRGGQRQQRRHPSAVLLHTLTLRDRLIERMTFRFRSKADRSRLG